MKEPKYHPLFCITRRAILACVLLLIACTAHANQDIFQGSKSTIVATVGSDSDLYFALMVVGFVVAAITGFLTKNWPAAIGGFVVGVIFVNTTMTFVGL